MSTRQSTTQPTDGMEDHSGNGTGTSYLFLSREYAWEEYDISSGRSEILVLPALSRTSMLLLDYRKFKAARTIQRAFRGWFARHMLAKKKHAIRTIQVAWRYFLNKRKKFRELEKKVESAIWAHYHRKATVIQSYFRGWWVREHIHDHYRLQRMQVHAAEELLHCVAFKLHHLLRTHQIPGIYSLRNSNCLSKVERLLAALSFKQHNDRVRLARAKREGQVRDCMQKFKASKFSTKIPYRGPEVCDPLCVELFNEVNATQKMHKILSLYEEASNRDQRVKPSQNGKKKKYSGRHLKKTGKENFCSDIVKSMKRWKILDNSKLNIDENIFKQPENVDKFLNEIQTLYDLMEGNGCYCSRSVKVQESNCPDFTKEIC